MSRTTEVSPTYATHEAGWRRVQALLPASLRLGGAGAPMPGEEWLDVGAFRVHLDCWRRPEAPVTLVVVHGGGGNGRLLAPFGAVAAALGYEVVAPDLPGYGLTRVSDKRSLVYDDWRDTLAAVLEAEAGRSRRPLVVFGASMGGMLAYDVTARTRIPAGLMATCFLAPREPEVRRRMVRWPWMSGLAGPMLTALPFLTDPLPVPMRLAGNMLAIANTPELAQAIAVDPLAGGTWMPGRFLRTFLESEPLVPPESFDVCPVLLTHPADDRWTEVSLSRPFFERLRVPKRLVLLENAGHFPVEEPGVSQLRQALSDFLAERGAVGAATPVR
ncbi:alpha/beta hydrolase [Pyxidicoccus fallax]|uniref:Alpha/beta hydrolase n=1 Tax=Pyxidicoccus fallax TaxID=394095 RepID=A0A848LR16_9BACT|nr:alpha/beta hydrolase [Pyxidicoccus fallax]NMO20119.1 alpha/beta hydrolase [Pyxidicoccus fallax]NPC80840.1 alpha/beta hydrolase [Pyxidicoccus fallax]